MFQIVLRPNSTPIQSMFWVDGSSTASSVTQFCFPLGGGRQGILFRLDGTLPRFFHPSGLSRVEFNVRLKLRRNVFPGEDVVHWTFIHASHAFYELLQVNDKLTILIIKAAPGTHHHPSCYHDPNN